MKKCVTVLTAAGLALITACSKAPEPGAAEKAGQTLDQGLERAGGPARDQAREGLAEKAGRELDRAILKAGERTQEALRQAEAKANQRLQEAGQALERAGQRLQERESRQ